MAGRSLQAFDRLFTGRSAETSLLSSVYLTPFSLAYRELVWYNTGAGEVVAKPAFHLTSYKLQLWTSTLTLLA